MLFIQGVGVHGDGWKPQVDALAPQYSCLTFDNRGLNRSQPVGAAVTVEQMAEDATRLMDARGWESAHVAGHSLGGLVALQMALGVRERVRSLALLCTFARGREAAPLTPWMFWTGLRTRLGTRRQRRRAFLKLVMPPKSFATAKLDELAATLAPLFGHDLADQPPVAASQLRALRRYDAIPRLGELAGLPTLVVSAAHDRIAPAVSGRALANAIVGAHFVLIENAAHGVPIEQPERINGLLLEHFRRQK